jgi:hypothetical protein
MVKDAAGLREAVSERISESVRRLRSIIGIVLGAAAVSLALLRSQDVTTAILLTICIVLGLSLFYWVWRHIEAQDDKIADLTIHNADCLEALHKRDIAIASLFGEAHTGGRAGLRRESDRSIFHLVMGEDAERAEQKLAELRQNGKPEAPKP